MFFHSHKSNQNSPTNPFAVLLILTDMRHTQGKRALSRRLPVKLSNRQTRRHENRTDGHKYGGGRKYAILRPSGKSRMKAYPDFCFPPAIPQSAACARPAGRVRPGRENLAKRHRGFVRQNTSNSGKKRPEAPFPAAFHRPENLFAARKFRLCGKKKISFSKEIRFLPHKNARHGGEMLV